MPNTSPVNDPFGQGDIVWVNFPFSDQPATSKKRPALIVSNELSNRLDHDFLMVPITSSIRQERFSVFIGENDVENPLPLKSEIRCNKICTIRDTLILGKITALKQERMAEVVEAIRQCTYLKKGRLYPFSIRQEE